MERGVVDRATIAPGRLGSSTRPRVAVGLLWPPYGPVPNILQAVRVARLARLDFMVLGDHVQGFAPRSAWDRRLGYWCLPGSSPHELHEVFTLLGRLSAAAGGLQLGVGVADVLRRHPITLAQAALTLSQLAKRPFILGLGAGEREGTEPYGLDPAPRADRLEEAADYIRTALASRGSSFDFDGRYFSADRAILDLPAPPGRMPRIWIAANGPRMLAVAGRQGDGWLPTFVRDPAEYERSLAVVREAAVAAGRPADAVLPALELNLLVAAREREARDLLDSQIARLTAAFTAPAAAWRASGTTHPLGDGFGGYRDILPERVDPAAMDEAIRTVPREVVERNFIWGTPDQVARRLQDLRDAGMRAVCFIPVSLHTRRATLYTFWALGRIARRLH